ALTAFDVSARSLLCRFAVVLRNLFLRHLTPETDVTQADRCPIVLDRTAVGLVRRKTSTLHELRDVFRENVSLDIDTVPFTARPERRDLQRMGNEGHAEVVAPDLDKSQADSVDSDRPLGDHLRRELCGSAKPHEDPGTLGGDALDRSTAIDVSLN